VPDSTLDLDLRGLRIRARLSGPEGATPCLLLHGWLDTGASFDRLAPLLHSKDLRTVALDLRGHGDSAWVGAGGFYHFVEYLADIDAALDSLQLALPTGLNSTVPTPIRIVGHSMGASLALLYAATRPARVSHVALLDGMPFVVQPAEVPARLVEYLDELKSIPRKRRTVPSLEHAVERLRKASPALRLDAALELASAGISEDPTQDHKLAWKWDPWLRVHSPLPFTDDILDALYPLVRAHVLIVRAGATWLPEETDLRIKLKTLFAPLDIHTLTDTSHHLHIEEPARVAELIHAAWR